MVSTGSPAKRCGPVSQLDAAMTAAVVDLKCAVRRVAAQP